MVAMMRKRQIDCSLAWQCWAYGKFIFQGDVSITNRAFIWEQ